MYRENAMKGGVYGSMECVGTAIMPPVAAIPANRPNGKTARDAYMRPLQPAGSKRFTDYRLLSGNL